MAIIKGTLKKDILNGSADNDLMYGYNNNDILNGGAGNDTLRGGNGADFLNGGLGNDFLNAGTGIDTLMGGDGNDALVINELNGDVIDGGSGIDNFHSNATDQTFDLTQISSIKNIEDWRLANTHSTLILDAQSVIDLSNDNNTLKVDASDDSNKLIISDNGWLDNGIAGNYHTFINGDATLQVNKVITDIETTPVSYEISNKTTAKGVSSIFNANEQDITIDFGGKQYSHWGLNSIDLTGFGLEDKLIIALHDGIVNINAQSSDTYVGKYYMSQSLWTGFTSYEVSSTAWNDRVSWQANATQAKLISRLFINTYNSSLSRNFTQSYIHSIQLTGLPANLPTSHFTFI